MSALTNFFATVLTSLHDLTGSYGWSIILFSLLVKLRALICRLSSSTAP